MDDESSSSQQIVNAQQMDTVVVDIIEKQKQRGQTGREAEWEAEGLGEKMQGHL